MWFEHLRTSDDMRKIKSALKQFRFLICLTVKGATVKIFSSLNRNSLPCQINTRESRLINQRHFPIVGWRCYNSSRRIEDTLRLHMLVFIWSMIAFTADTFGVKWANARMRCCSSRSGSCASRPGRPSNRAGTRPP